MHWDTLRKTSSIIHVAYDHTNATLFAEDVRVRADDSFDVSIDLNKNLRTRAKGVGTYIDARDLANGGIEALQTVQLDDDQVLDGIGRYLEQLDGQPKTWRLHVALAEKSHWFEVRPELRGQNNYTSLWLRVVSPLKVSPTEAPDSRS